MSIINGSTATHLDFQNQRYFVQGESKTFDNLVTFSRGSLATVVDSTGKITYALNNLLTYSEQIDNAAWTKSSSTVTANATTSPDGFLTADLVTASAGSAQHYIQAGVTYAVNTSYCASIYVKAGTYSLIQLALNSQNVYANFNVSTGVVSSSAGTINASITSVGNGWFRCSIVFTNTAGANLVISLISTSTDGRIPTWNAAGTETAYFWGAQVEAVTYQTTPSEYRATTSAAYHGPRFDYDPVTLQPKGLLVEEQRTNSIRNNTMQGAVAGTPGTMPTNWYAFTVRTGITQEVVGTGSENGISYIDFRISGTPDASGPYIILTETNVGVAALSGQTWAFSCYLKLQSGSLSGVSSTRIFFQENDSAGVYLTEQQIVITDPTSSGLATQRVSAKRTLTNASTAFLKPGIIIGLSGSAVDVTIRIGLPQLERGDFATSVIPTTTTAVTRNADVPLISGTNFTSWYNPIEGTILVNADSFVGTSTTTYMPVAISDGTGNNYIRAYIYNGYRGMSVQVGGVSQADTATATAGYAPNVFSTWGIAYRADDFAWSNAGSAVVNDTSGSIPVVDRLNIGSLFASLNGHITYIKYYNRRLPNSVLQSLTA